MAQKQEPYLKDTIDAINFIENMPLWMWAPFTQTSLKQKGIAMLAIVQGSLRA